MEQIKEQLFVNLYYKNRQDKNQDTLCNKIALILLFQRIN